MRIAGSLSALLREQTAALHTQLDTLPFFQALQRGTLPAPAIVSLLRAVAIIHAVVERELSRVSHPGIAALGRQAVPKTPLLIADLETLHAGSLPSVADAVQTAVGAAAEIVADGDSPFTLVGILYVLEGSQNGGMALRQAYEQCLHVPPDQLSYFGCYGKGTAAHWKTFMERLDALALDAEQATAAAGAAVKCFEWFQRICAALYPYEDEHLRYHVAGVNCEAGNHAMPQNPQEVALALLAGKAAWDRYPYLEHRFGARGRRFTSSDSCWLVALARIPVDAATKNLTWLRTVLASRGIPTVILAGHLGAISEALAKAFPEQPALCAAYQRFLAMLESERQSLAGVRMLPALVEQFDQRLGACAGLSIPSASQLIASAWVDEQSGIRGALDATTQWFTDPSRFPADWVLHVHDLVAALDRAGRAPC